MTYSFSNPASTPPTTAKTYVDALLEVLGDRPPLAVMGELTPWLDHRLRGVSDDALRPPEKPGKWSVVQIIQHLRLRSRVGFRAA